jgi:hypothetical protein
MQSLEMIIDILLNDRSNSTKDSDVAFQLQFMIVLVNKMLLETLYFNLLV